MYVSLVYSIVGVLCVAVLQSFDFHPITINVYLLLKILTDVAKYFAQIN